MANDTYRHHKGALYKVLYVAHVSDTDRKGNFAVVYRAPNGQTHVRDVSEFHELVEWPDGVVRPRFIKESQ